MKISLKKEIFPGLMILIAWVAGFYFYQRFPETVITHWNFEGIPDGFSSKAVGAFLLPAILTGMHLMFLVLPFIDPKKDRYESFEKTYQIFKNLIIATLFIIFIISCLINIGYNIPMNIATPLIIGILFIVLGNYMGKLKQNWFMGMRLPWTMSSENVWNKTNRFGGWMMVTFGFIIILSPLLPRNWGYAIFILGVLMVTVGTSIYSYLVYRKEQQENLKA